MSARANWSTPGILERLGIAPDRDLALELGITRQGVAYMRKRLGITAPTQRIPDGLVELLGHQPDNELGERFQEVGWGAHRIRHLRHELGIERYRSPCGTPARYNAGCRCRACKDANNTRMKQFWKDHPDVYKRHLERKNARVAAARQSAEAARERGPTPEGKDF